MKKLIIIAQGLLMVVFFTNNAYGQKQILNKLKKTEIMGINIKKPKL